MDFSKVGTSNLETRCEKTGENGGLIESYGKGGEPQVWNFVSPPHSMHLENMLPQALLKP